jgi:site-specific DNA-methyltransferase (adenine-specific)
MSTYFDTTEALIYQGNCLEELKNIPDNSIDSIVTDPPYGLANLDAKVFTTALLKWVAGNRDYMPSGKGFMGKSWDAFVPPPAVWDECFRVLKPGGHMLVFAGSRTQDLMGLSVRMAGFEIRDSIAWLYGSGFPKSMDVSKAIDKAAGAEREVIGRNPNSRENATKDNTLYESGTVGKTDYITAPATDDAKKWSGWGTALKPAHEPIIVARKPLTEKTVVDNVLKYGTGGINIDAARIGDEVRTSTITENGFGSNFMDDNWVPSGKSYEKTVTGRFPANVIFDETTAEILDQQTGITKSGQPRTDKGTGGIWKDGDGIPVGPQYGDEGGASRFFYVSKASKKDRNEGLEGLESAFSGYSTRYCTACGKNVPYVGSCGCDADVEMRPANPQQNIHPTVKPTTLMEYLVKLVTPVGGTVLDPFTGSGSTGKAAIRNGFRFIGVEMTEDYLPIIKARIEHEINSKGLF